MQDSLIGLLDGQRLPKELRRAHVNGLQRAGGNVARIEDERVREAQRIDDLVEHGTPRDRIDRQFLRQEADLPCLPIDGQFPLLAVIDNASGWLQGLVLADVLDRFGPIAIPFQDLHVTKPAGENGKCSRNRAPAEQHAPRHPRLLGSSCGPGAAFAAGTKVWRVVGNALVATHYVRSGSMRCSHPISPYTGGTSNAFKSACNTVTRPSIWDTSPPSPRSPRNASSVPT
jgi:hypothetical protein